MRIVSLLASGTELVCELGAGRRLVGRSHECQRPHWVRDLPAVTAPTFPTDGSSEAIDAEVKRRVQAGEPLYRVDRALLEQLEPDLLITQEHCRVCAVSPADLEKGGPPPPGATAVTLEAQDLPAIFRGFRSVAAALGMPEAGDRLLAGYRRRLERLGGTGEGPTLLVIDWVRPLFLAGNWVPQLVFHAGARPVGMEEGSRAGQASWAQVRRLDPDWIVVAPCGYGLERTRREVPLLEQYPGWKELRAVRAGRVALADGDRYFNRSGPSVVETAEILHEILWGGHRFRGEAWEPSPGAA